MQPPGYINLTSVSSGIGILAIYHYVTCLPAVLPQHGFLHGLNRSPMVTFASLGSLSAASLTSSGTIAAASLNPSTANRHGLLHPRPPLGFRRGFGSRGSLGNRFASATAGAAPNPSSATATASFSSSRQLQRFRRRPNPPPGFRQWVPPPASRPGLRRRSALPSEARLRRQAQSRRRFSDRCRGVHGWSQISDAAVSSRSGFPRRRAASGAHVARAAHRGVRSVHSAVPRHCGPPG